MTKRTPMVRQMTQFGPSTRIGAQLFVDYSESPKIRGFRKASNGIYFAPS